MKQLKFKESQKLLFLENEMEIRNKRAAIRMHTKQKKGRTFFFGGGGGQKEKDGKQRTIIKQFYEETLDLL